MVSENVAYQLQNFEEAEIDESPVKWCSVTLSDIIARGKRLEASVYDVEAKQAREIVIHGKFPAIALGGDDGLTSSYTGARFKRIWVDHSEYPIYQPSSIVDIKPTPDGYISKRTDTDIDALRVKKGQILMTCSGTIGKVAYVSDTLDGLIFSHDLLRIDSNDDNAGYIYAYLKSKIGQQILLTNSYGAVITHIEPEHLADVPIPNAPVEIKQEIHKMVIDSYALRDESNKLLDEAMDLLVQELKLPPIEEIGVDDFVQDAPVETFLVKLSQLNNRVDASYHVPIVKAIVDYLNKNAAEVTTIGDCRISRNVILPGRFKRVYVDEGHGRIFIGGKQLGELDPTNKKYLSVTQHGERIEEQLELHENMTLITCSGTIGKVALVGKHWENWTANQHIEIFHFEQDEYDEEALQQQSVYVSLTPTQQESCLRCYGKMTPYVIESVLSKPEDVGSPDRSKKIGAYSFVKDDVKISRAIVVVLYMLRCCLAHGDFSPDEASNNVYKYAYEVLCIPLKKLR